MVQFAEVLSQVGADFAQAAKAKPGVRVNTAGWDSWLQADSDDRTVGERLAQTYILDDEAVEPDEPLPKPDPQPQSVPQEEQVTSKAAPPPPPSRPSPQPLDLASELALERLMTLSERDLRALRRQLARRVHPDLPNADQPDLRSMVRVNVAIDTALRLRRTHPR